MADAAVTQEDEVRSESVVVSVCPTPEQLEARYLAAANALLDDARERDSLRILVDVLVWTLARIIVGRAGSWGAGDVMRQLGNYVCGLVERQRAQAEAEEAKRQGQIPH